MNLTMVGRLDPCFLIAYAVEAERLQHLVPRGLGLIRNGSTAFLNIVICRVERMRPFFVPHALGATYWHVAYRLQVSARLKGGGTLEGLYFLRSDVDKRLFAMSGNFFTDFRFHVADVRFRATAAEWELEVKNTQGGMAEAIVRLRPGTDGALLVGSVFKTLAEREGALKYAPLGLSSDDLGQVVKVAEVVRDDRLWREDPVEVVAADWAFLRGLGVGDARVERATLVAPIDYVWRLGRRAKIK